MRISDWSSDVCSSDLQVRRSTHEPGIGRAVGRAGLAEQRPVHVTQPLRRAAGYYAFGDMNDLICCHRVHKLAPRRLEARHGPAVPVGLVAAIAGPPVLRPDDLAMAVLDRKSTRLNSSH